MCDAQNFAYVSGVLVWWFLTHLESWSRWESDIVQSEGECSLNWSSVCLDFPGTNQKMHIYLCKHRLPGSKKKQPSVEAAKKQTLNTADTVWKEDPFFFPPFLLPPESPGDRHRGWELWVLRTHRWLFLPTHPSPSFPKWPCVSLRYVTKMVWYVYILQNDHCIKSG